MPISKWIPLGFLSCAVFTLVACGGSGSGAAQGGDTLTLSGDVTDMPIADATVIVTVDGQTFTAPQPTDSEGHYEVEIESADPDALVTAEAFDPNGTVRFRAIAGAFGDIEGSASADGTATDVDITNVTTAQTVLAARLTADGSIDSVEELADVAARVDTEDMLELAAAIKLVVENIDGVTLPVDEQDTLSLAEAIVAGDSTFIDDVSISAPGSLETAIDLVLSDGNATIPFTTETAAGVYFAEEDFAIFALLPEGYGFTVSQDDESVEMFDWVVDAEGTLTLFFSGPEPYSEAVTLLGRMDDIVNVVVRESDEAGAGDPATARYFEFEDGFDAQTMPGTYSSLDDPGHLTVLLDDGTGYDLDAATGAEEDWFTWAVDAEGVLTISEDEGGESQQVRKLTGSTADRLRLLVVEIGAAGDAGEIAVVDAIRGDQTTGGTGSDATELLLAGSTYAVTESDELSLFTFGTDGTFSQISQAEVDQAWELEAEEGNWSVDANGIITTQFPIDTDTGTAEVLQGLGEDFMVVETDEGEMLQVTRIVPLEPALIIGSFSVVDETTGIASETVRFDADFTGVHVAANGTGEEFEWGLTASGRLMVETQGETDFDSETMEFYRLAGSGGDLMRFIIVHQVNGELAGFDASTGEAPEVLELVTLTRN